MHFTSQAVPHLLVGDNTVSTGNLSVLDVDGTGALSHAANSPHSTGNNIRGLTGTPDGKFVYVSHENNTVDGFAIDAAGQLSPVPGSPLSISSGASGLGKLVTDGSDHLYVIDRNLNRLRAFTVASDGSLTELSGSPFDLGTAPLDRLVFFSL